MVMPNQHTKYIKLLNVVLRCPIWIFLGLFVGMQVVAQHPFYYPITTENGLSTNEVYNLIQDNQGNLLVATDNGMIRYNGISFQRIPTNSNSKQSFTNFVMNSEGEIWCMGFPGNIFRVREDSLLLLINFSSKVKNYPSLRIDQSDVLNISGDSGTWLYNTVQKQWIDTIIKNNFFSTKYYLHENLVQTYAHDTSRKTNNIESVQYYTPPFSYKQLKVGGFSFKFQSKQFYILNSNVSKSRIFEIRNDSALLFHPLDKPINTYRVTSLCSMGDSVLLMGTYNGLYAFNRQFEPLYKTSCFQEETISAFYIDYENNLWIASTASGLKRVPYINRTLFNTNNSTLKENDIRLLATDGQQLFMGLRNGTIQTLDKKQQIKTLFTPPQGHAFLRDLHYDSRQNKLSFTKIISYLYDLKTGQLKQLNPTKNYAANSVRPIGKDNYLIARNSSTVVIQPKKMNNFIQANKNIEYWNLFKNSKEVYGVQTIAEKTLFSEYNPKTQTFWLCMDDKIMLLKNGQYTECSYEGNSFIANSVYFDLDGNTWIAGNNGLYFCDSLQQIRLFTQQHGLYDNIIKKIRGAGNELYLIYAGAFQRMNRHTLQLDTYTREDGLPSEEINDICLFGQYYCVATAKGLLKIPQKASFLNPYPPRLSVKKVLKDGQTCPLQNNYELDYDYKDFELYYDVVNFRSMGDYFLKWRFKGRQNTWNTEKNPTGLLRLNNLSHGTYQLELKLVNQDAVESLTLQYILNIHPPFYLNFSFWLTISLLLGLIGFLGYRYRINSIKSKALIKQQLIRSEVKALKSQMNPHFIFNALNSIQDLILKNDMRQTNKYLVKISRLIREVLKTSDKESITLEEELDMLGLYTDLEKLRFGEDLSIHIIAELDAYQKETIPLPPLIIQPYVENAFKHGLLHKEGKKELKIHFWMQQEQLHCHIQDNGIGRQQSQALKDKKSGHRHISFASKANQKRIDLINASQSKQIQLNIIDLPNNSGTVVAIIFPLS